MFGIQVQIATNIQHVHLITHRVHAIVEMLKFYVSLNATNVVQFHQSELNKSCFIRMQMYEYYILVHYRTEASYSLFCIIC